MIVSENILPLSKMRMNDETIEFRLDCWCHCCLNTFEWLWGQSAHLHLLEISEKDKSQGQNH